MDSISVAVADDDPEIGSLVSDYLTQHGFRVSTALNGQEMWREMKKATIDMVILDVMLPGDDGLTLCRQLRSAGAPRLTR